MTDSREQSKPTPTAEQIADAARRLAADERLQDYFAYMANEAKNTANAMSHEFDRSRLRFAWLAASPAVLGSGLVVFVAVAWGAFDLIESSSTTSTAFIVGALLMLVPAALAAWRGNTAGEHSQQVFEHAESVLNPPPRPPVTALPSKDSSDAGLLSRD